MFRTAVSHKDTAEQWFENRQMTGLAIFLTVVDTFKGYSVCKPRFLFTFGNCSLTVSRDLRNDKFEKSG